MEAQIFHRAVGKVTNYHCEHLKLVVGRNISTNHVRENILSEHSQESFTCRTFLEAHLLITSLIFISSSLSLFSEVSIKTLACSVVSLFRTLEMNDKEMSRKKFLMSILYKNFQKSRGARFHKYC